MVTTRYSNKTFSQLKQNKHLKIRQLENIYEAAVKKNWDEVRRILNMNLFSYRQAQVFCEGVKNDKVASKYILKQAICKCGQPVTKWEYRKKLQCGSCAFREAMKKIEYEKVSK